MAAFNPGMDDVFDDAADEDMCFAQKAWSKTEDDIRTTGYRMGLAAGQEEKLQEGFDEGYKQATNLAYEIGKLQGHLCDMLSVEDAKAHAVQKNLKHQMEAATGGSSKNAAGHETETEVRERLMQISNEVQEYQSSLPTHLCQWFVKQRKLHGEKALDLTYFGSGIDDITALFSTVDLDSNSRGDALHRMIKRLTDLFTEKQNLREKLQIN